MYNCGPTVYNFAHIGNLRAYVFADVLRRTLEYNGYVVKQVMNITDVGEPTSDESEDKMAKGLRREGKPQTLEAMKELGEFYATAFVSDLKSLNIKIPDLMPRASNHIGEDLELIKILLGKKFAYKTSDAIYFDVSQFTNYGKLGNVNLDGQIAGARVQVNPTKRNAFDFALWKFSSGPIGWDSEWGRGFPGWHIECSAMSRRYLGQPFDIHTGGVDHIPIHHNNEIAQSESAYGVPLANYWIHNEHLKFGGEKVAKSVGNVLYLKDLYNKGISPLSFRYFLLTASYRAPIDYNESAVKNGSVTSLENIYKSLARIPTIGKINPVYADNFLNSINRDLNTAEGLSLLHLLLADTTVAPEDKLATCLDFDRVLGLDFENGRKNFLSDSDFVLPDEVRNLIVERDKARANKEWQKSDDLRKKIIALGFEVVDSESSSSVKKV